MRALALSSWLYINEQINKQINKQINNVQEKFFSLKKMIKI